VKKWANKRTILYCALLALLVYFVFCLPAHLFDKPHSTVLYSSKGELLSAIIAEDGQWRFPHTDTVSDKFKTALIHFEDKNFHDHNGVYLPSLFRAVYQNITSSRVVSGASTLTMQVVRMSRDNPPRTVHEKLLEMLHAMRLEWRHSKDEILALYASNAPFGGNVVGLDAAAWRYFGRTPDQLSWAEAATLAVLPNAPSLIYPGKNQERLLAKRNRLLHKLHEAHFMDEQTLELSLLEPLPQKPFPLPQQASHLLSTLVKTHGKGKRYYTTIDDALQERVTQMVQYHLPQWQADLVNNAAVLVVEVKTGNVLAYVGNTQDAQNRYSNMVDVIRAPRSTGSILKPFLFAAMLKDGLMLPHTLMADVPIQFDGFSPQNYLETYDGAVPASRALSRSLNVPVVLMLKDYSYPRFYHLLQNMQFSHLKKPADHYGLSLILGGAEASLWDITHAYASMSRALVEHNSSNGKYFEHNYTSRRYVLQHPEQGRNEDKFPLYDAGSIWSTYQALLEVNRPHTELGWEAYSSATPIAWKTGTSFGNRDAWAVGTTPEYVVGVWVGNADGQGRPLLTGVTAAAPLLFDVFNALPTRSWFYPPYDDMERIAVCKQSGMRTSMYCEHADTTYVPKAGLQTEACTYHQRIFTNAMGTLRLNANCAATDEMVPHNWFVLPPVQEYYYKPKHPEYRSLPAFAPDCIGEESSPIGLIYPKSDAKIFIPKNIQGQRERIVLKATHRDRNATLFWYLNDEYLGQTTTLHQLEIKPAPGKYTLTLTDDKGEHFYKVLEVLEK
jgi:penicillin-binding protein 1C